jgi:hypothetical protein
MQTPLLQREDRRKNLLKQRIGRVWGRAPGNVPEAGKTIITLFLNKFWLIAAGVGRARGLPCAGGQNPAGAVSSAHG